MNAINELLKEHEAVRLTLKILKEMGRQIEKTRKIEKPEDVEQLFEFFSIFVNLIYRHAFS